MVPEHPIRLTPTDGEPAYGQDAARLAADSAAASPIQIVERGSAPSPNRNNSPGALEQIDQPTAKVMRESQRLIAIGRLTAEIAHEINNPLEAVGNLIYLALHEPGVPGRAVDFLRTAERELERVVSISKQTLSFSRESAKLVPVRIVELMDEVVSIYSRRIASKRLALTREYSTADTMLAYPGEIRQVLSNLVTNAIEACSEGGRLRLRVRDVLQGKTPGIRITVADNGIGIPESARKRLGEMFFSTKGESGTGLSLWVTSSIVARYGGTMRLRSSTGTDHGTCLSIFLPTANDHASQVTTDQTTNQSTDQRKPQTGNVTEISLHPDHANNAQSGSSRHKSKSVQREG